MLRLSPDERRVAAAREKPGGAVFQSVHLCRLVQKRALNLYVLSMFGGSVWESN